MTADELLDEHTEPVAALARELRRVIVAAMPTATERVYSGWHGLGYVHPEAGYVCGIFPQSDEVKLGFEHGHLLPDPDGLFSLGGTQVRYIVLRPGDPVPATAIADLIAEALELRPSR